MRLINVRRSLRIDIVNHGVVKLRCVGMDLTKKIAPSLDSAHALSAAEVLAILDVSVANGLSEDEAKHRFEFFG